jgi:hypothetical protein
MNSAGQYNTIDFIEFNDVTNYSLGAPFVFLIFLEHLVLFGEPNKFSYTISLPCIQIPNFLFYKVKYYYLSPRPADMEAQTELLIKASLTS